MSQQDLIFAVSTIIIGGSLVAFVVVLWRGRGGATSTVPTSTAPTSTVPTSTAPTSTAPTSTAPTSRSDAPPEVGQVSRCGARCNLPHGIRPAPELVGWHGRDGLGEHGPDQHTSDQQE